MTANRAPARTCESQAPALECEGAALGGLVGRCFREPIAAKCLEEPDKLGGALPCVAIMCKCIELTPTAGRNAACDAAPLSAPWL